VSTSNLERLENPSSRRCQIFTITSRSQTELEKAYTHQNNLEFDRTRCTGCLAADRNCRSKISYTRQSLSGLMASNSNIEIQRFQNKSESLSMLLGASLYIIISMCHTLETRLKDSVRDTPIGWRNILTYSRLTL